MNIKNKLIAFFIFFSILTLSIINIKNPEKIKFYLFTYQTEKISLGNLITLTFISGFTLSTVLMLNFKNNLQESLSEDFINDEVVDKSVENISSQEFESSRPPERDVRESQPTISVNYRFVDQDNSSYSLRNKEKNPNSENNDWLNKENEW